MINYDRNTKFMCCKDYCRTEYSIWEPPKRTPVSIKEGEIFTFEEIMKIDSNTSMDDLINFFIPLAEWRDKQLNDILGD